MGCLERFGMTVQAVNTEEASSCPLVVLYLGSIGFVFKVVIALCVDCFAVSCGHCMT
jgi:hypothetical protein